MSENVYTGGCEEQLYRTRCGDYFGGRKQLCTQCEEAAAREYPQGWTGYPGDTCRHGAYTGGCGIDWSCFACEMGEE